MRSAAPRYDPDVLGFPPATDPGYEARAAAALRSILNDLKRDELSAAEELAIDRQLLEEILAGRRPMPMSLIRRAVRIWPVSERDLLPTRSDAPHGVVIMR